MPVRDCLPTNAARPRRTRGFSLVEVMVALAVLSVGLLGIAKMQTLALSSTSGASKRALAALQAASLAASMHADRPYWAAGGLPPPTLTITGATVNDATLGAPANCLSAASGGTAPCDNVTVAAYDLQRWASSLQSLLPNDSATITCSNVVNVPVTCTIQISWTERAIAINAQEATTANTVPAANASAFNNPTYTLVIEP